MTPNIVDPDRQKRVVEQTAQRLGTDANFKACVKQAITAARNRDPNMAVMNVALIIVQVEQIAREEVLANIIAARPTEPGKETPWNVGFEQGYGVAEHVVQKLCDDFGAKKVLRATEAPPSTNGPRGLDS